MLILQTILRRDHGIAKRHLAVPKLEGVYDLSADELNATFRREAPLLASRALTQALEQAGLRPGDLDALLVCTCTGYLCPGVTSYVAEQLGLRANVFLQDLVGLGCGAAIPMLRAASHVLAAQPEAKVACIAVEICSAAFYVDDDPGVLVSACLFGDGAAATIWRAAPGSRGLRCHGFDTVHDPASRDRLLPVIVLTARSEEPFVIEARDHGANEFVAKPYTVDSLYKRLAAIIAFPRPYVNAPTYFGPERRRKQTAFNGADRRGVDPNGKPS
jgi:predicted naringenin-chalcone synthase